MRYSLFGNDELGWTVAKIPPQGHEEIEFYCFVLESWTYILCINDLAKTKEKAEAKLKELQYA